MLHKRLTLSTSKLMSLSRTAACSGVSVSTGGGLRGRPSVLGAVAATLSSPPSAGAGAFLGRPPLLTEAELSPFQSSRSRLPQSQARKISLMMSSFFQFPFLPGRTALHFGLWIRLSHNQVFVVLSQISEEACKYPEISATQFSGTSYENDACSKPQIGILSCDSFNIERTKMRISSRPRNGPISILKSNRHVFERSQSIEVLSCQTRLSTRFLRLADFD
jgi:hypothetical protein